MEQNISSTKLPLRDFINILNIICNSYSIQYAIYPTDAIKDIYRVEMLYKDIRYISNDIKGILQSLIDGFEEIKYLLAHNIELKLSTNVFETLDYFINCLKYNQDVQSKRSKI